MAPRPNGTSRRAAPRRDGALARRRAPEAMPTDALRPRRRRVRDADVGAPRGVERCERDDVRSTGRRARARAAGAAVRARVVVRARASGG